MIKFLLLSLALSGTNIAAAKDDRIRKKVQNGGNREGKFFPLFQVVRFENDACIAGGSKNGTCYTEAECASRGGSNAGSCAGGFGVCCTFTVFCGGMSNENCTYFDSNAITEGGCSATICPCGNDICQLRLDFENFMITGPSTAVGSVAKRLVNSGVVAPAGTVSVAEATQCLTDRFSVTSGGGINPPTICGTNSGEHMYVEMDDRCCNTLDFQFNMTPQGTTVASRTFSIKVTQYSCGFPNLAPTGCTQYFFGAASGTVMTFNYNGGTSLHLANQDQQICISASSLQGGACCSYAAAKAKTKGFDCVQVPQARSNADGNPIPSNLCGNGGLDDGAGAAGTVCTIASPFRLNFRSDQYEVVPEAGFAAGSRGFTLMYMLDSINCIAGNPTTNP